MSDRPQADVRRRYVYRGRVQGVGFRMTAASIARRSKVAGYVRNLRNGDVELVAESREDVLQQFLAEIDAAFPGYITERAAEDLPATEAFSGFEIRR